MIEEHDGNNGFKLSISQWRGEVSQSILDLKDNIKLLRDETDRNFERFEKKFDDFVNKVLNNFEEHKKENDREITNIKISNAKVGIKIGAIATAFLIIIEVALKAIFPHIFKL